MLSALCQPCVQVPHLITLQKNHVGVVSISLDRSHSVYSMVLAYTFHVEWASLIAMQVTVIVPGVHLVDR